MSYVVVEKNNQQVSYLVTSACDQPRIAVGTGYIPLRAGTLDAPMIKVSQVAGYETLRAGSYTSTTRKSTSTSVGSSYVGCAGTSSSSGSTLQTTIEASTAMSFTSTAAETRVSTSGYNGLSGAEAQTCSSTSSWKGVSTSRSDYQTSEANINGPYSGAGLSSTTVLSRISTSGYTGSSSSGSTYDTVVANSNVGAFTKTSNLTQLSTTGYDHQSAYLATRTWYDSPTRTYGYSGYSTNQVAYTLRISMETGGSGGWAGGETHVYYKAYNLGVQYYGWYSDTRNAAYCFYGFTADGQYRSDVYRYGNPYMNWVLFVDGNPVKWNRNCPHSTGNSDGWECTYDDTGTYYVNNTVNYVSANTDGMQGVYSTLTETYVDYANPHYDYGWVETAVVPLICTTTTAYAGRSSSSAPYYTTVDENHGNAAGFTSIDALTRSSTSGYTGISSKVSYYDTTVANSDMPSFSVTSALTRSSTSAYSGTSYRRSDYIGTQVNSVGMTDPVAMTCESIYGYSGVSTRQSDYYTTHPSAGVLSYQTALTRESISGYATIESVYSTEAATGQVLSTDSHWLEIKHTSYSHYDGSTEPECTLSATMSWGEPYLYYGYTACAQSRHRYEYKNFDWIYTTNYNGKSAVLTVVARSIADWNYFSVTGEDDVNGKHVSATITHYNYQNFIEYYNYYVTQTTGTISHTSSHTYATLTRESVYGYSGVSSKQSAYNVVENSPAGLANVTTLTRSSTSGYSGQLSRTSSYETLIPNDGANALAAQALTCSSTSKYLGISSTSASMSSTELRTSYFTSVYSESTTRSYTVATETVVTGTAQTTITMQSLTSGNGYRVVGGAIVADPNGYSTVEVLSSTNTQYASSTWVAISETTSTARTSTYTRTSEAIKSYGDSTSLSTYVSTKTYVHTYSDYV